MLYILAKILLRIFGWKSVGSFSPALKKAVMIVAPHTSSRDVILGVAFRKALRLERIRFLGKQELFKPPFGFIFRWLGGVPVNRFQHSNLVDDVVKMFNSKDEFIIALSPEGTRKKVDRLRTGFYHIAKNAGVPIVMLALDFEHKQFVFSEPFFATGDETADFKHILRFFGPIKGHHPEFGISHLA